MTTFVLNTTQAQTMTDDGAKSISEALKKEIDLRRFFGGMVMVGTADKILYHEAFGDALISPERYPMLKDSIFDMASVTKAVCTATAAAILMDRGQLDPDALMLKYLPDYTGKGVESLTLRHLASHTSGFLDWPRVGGDNHEFKGDELFRQLLKFDATSPPGTKSAYACRNLIVVAHIVERQSGMPFDQFCKKEIFEPLEMHESYFNQVEPSKRVAGHHGPQAWISHAMDTRDAGRAIGSAGLYTTAADLANFCQMMLNRGVWKGKRILSEKVIDDITKPFMPELTGFGFGWQTNVNESSKTMSKKAFGHGGNTGTSVWIDPEKKIFVLVLTNRNHPDRPHH
ncbi:MAG: beta-lactamase family protein [Phycisphaerales bacterium]|nr:beta-lactamase family protein [Phycisphaerales bacterium]